MNVLPLRVLVIASDASDTAFATRVLEDHGDQVRVAKDVTEALSTVSQEHYDVALVSLTLPRGDGLALVHHLRALHPQTDVIVMTGDQDMQESAHAMALGVLAHVMRPLTGDALLVAADRARERRLLINERNRLATDEAVSRTRSATYARCAAFVAETDPTAVARGALDAAVAELPSHAGALYRRDPMVARTLARMARVGEPSALPPTIPLEDVAALDPSRVVHRLDGRVRVVMLGDTDVEAVIDLVPDANQQVTDAAVQGLEVVAALATAAFTASRKVEAMARVGIKDPETSAYTFAYFGDVAVREIDRAGRYGRRFALLTIDMTGMNPSVQTKREIADGILEAVRDSDVLARVEDEELYLLLPETGLLGAFTCRRRILQRLGDLDAIEGTRGHTSVGVAVYPTDGADLGRLLRASRSRAERSREGVWDRLGLEGQSFWQAVDTLLGGEDDAGVARDGSIALHPDLARAHDGLSLARHAALPASSVARLGGWMVADAVRRRLAGTLYVAGDPALEAEVARAMDSPDLRLRAWILGRREGPGARLRLPVDDPRLGERVVFFLLTEIGGYMLVARPLEPDTLLAYHAADLDLVDGLVHALQRTYHLQPEVAR
jgi:two-component system, cell cycle response regulator